MIDGGPDVGRRLRNTLSGKNDRAARRVAREGAGA
jgi:hypothetical protein